MPQEGVARYQTRSPGRPTRRRRASGWTRTPGYPGNLRAARTPVPGGLDRVPRQLVDRGLPGVQPDYQCRLMRPREKRLALASEPYDPAPVVPERRRAPRRRVGGGRRRARCTRPPRTAEDELRLALDLLLDDDSVDFAAQTSDVTGAYVGADQSAAIGPRRSGHRRRRWRRRPGARGVTGQAEEGIEHLRRDSTSTGSWLSPGQAGWSRTVAEREPEGHSFPMAGAAR